MKRLLSAALVLTMLTLSSCTKSTDSQMTAQERTDLYSSAISGARSQEENDAFGVITSADDPNAELIFQLLGLSDENMESYAISVSPMNVRAYGIAIIMPAKDQEETVRTGLQTFIDTQRMNFEFYLPDQYEIAQNARLEKLDDGALVLVMCQDQDTVYDSIVSALQAK